MLVSISFIKRWEVLPVRPFLIVMELLADLPVAQMIALPSILAASPSTSAGPSATSSSSATASANGLLIELILRSQMRWQLSRASSPRLFPGRTGCLASTTSTATASLLVVPELRRHRGYEVRSDDLDEWLEGGHAVMLALQVWREAAFLGPVEHL